MIVGHDLFPMPERGAIVDRGLGEIARAYLHAVWSEGWRELTGVSWEEHEAKEAARKARFPRMAHLHVTLEGRHAGLSTVEVTSPGMLAALSVSALASVERGHGDPSVTITVPMSQVTLMTAPR